MGLFKSPVRFFLLLLIALFTAIESPSAHAQNEKITFAVIGDYGLTGQNEANVANLVKSWNPNFIVTVGDNNYISGSANTIDANIGQYYHDFIFPYTGSYGAGAATNRFFPALGNHDWVTTNAQPYLNYFSLPGNERYYDFVRGPVHFFMLDSDTHEPHGNTAASVQATWLKNSLAASSSPWNIVLLHHAPFSSAHHGSNAASQWPYEAWGADAVLAGHDHTYERIIKGAIPYFVNGLGGASIYEFRTPIAGSQLRYNADHGAMFVEATNAYISFKFIARTGVTIDSFALGTPPSASVNSIMRASPNPSSAARVNFTVTFSESVTGVNRDDFSLTTNGVSGATVSSVTGSGSVYTVKVNTGVGNGDIRLDIPVIATITDLSGNPLSNLPFTEGETYNSERPHTFKSTAVQDGWIRESTEASNNGGTMNSSASTLNLGDDPANRQYRAILSFDTSTVPDNAVITKVTLKFKYAGVTGTLPFGTHGNLLVDVRKGAFSNSAVLQLNDFKAAASKNNVLSFTSAKVNNWYTKAFNAANFQYINLLGITQFRLRFKTDDNNDGAANFLKIYSGNAGAANRPQLVIEYYVP
ncbi:MAG: metallophosphoesterase [Chloroflexota bacterium]